MSATGGTLPPNGEEPMERPSPTAAARRRRPGRTAYRSITGRRGGGRTLPALVTVAVAAAVAVVAAPPLAYGAGEAPGAPGGGSSWTTGDKTATGTAAGGASRVWFTVAGGITTEVF